MQTHLVFYSQGHAGIATLLVLDPMTTARYDTWCLFLLVDTCLGDSVGAFDCLDGTTIREQRVKSAETNTVLAGVCRFSHHPTDRWSFNAASLSAPPKYTSPQPSATHHKGGGIWPRPPVHCGLRVGIYIYIYIYIYILFCFFRFLFFWLEWDTVYTRPALGKCWLWRVA